MNNSSGRNKKSIGSTILIIALVLAYGWWENRSKNPQPEQGAKVSQNQTSDIKDAFSDVAKPKNDIPKINIGAEKSRQQKDSALRESTPNVLTKVGRDYHSRAGLIYGGGGRETRREHVMRHAKDDRSKPAHGVFDDADAVFALVDEAYEKVKSGSRDVRTQKQGDRMSYTVKMGRRIGYKGGNKGDKRPLKSIRIILVDNNQVITAYPY